MKYISAVLVTVLILGMATAVYSVERLYQSRNTNLVLRTQVTSLELRLKAQEAQASQLKQAQPTLEGQIQSLAPNGNNVTNIIYNQYGFDPNIDTVTAGSSVTIENQTKASVTIKAIDFFGRNILYSPLNLGTIQPQQQKSFVLSGGGVVQYQANNSPAIRAEIGTQ